jgi:hypothetical protein
MQQCLGPTASMGHLYGLLILTLIDTVGVVKGGDKGNGIIQGVHLGNGVNDRMGTESKIMNLPCGVQTQLVKQCTEEKAPLTTGRVR